MKTSRKALLPREPQHNQAPDDEALMFPKDAAKFLNRPENWLAKRRVTGDGPRYVKLGIRVFYRRSDLKAWINKHVISSTSQKTEAASAAAA